MYSFKRAVSECGEIFTHVIFLIAAVDSLRIGTSKLKECGRSVLFKYCLGVHQQNTFWNEAPLNFQRVIEDHLMGASVVSTNSYRIRFYAH